MNEIVRYNNDIVLNVSSFLRGYWVVVNDYNIFCCIIMCMRRVRAQQTSIIISVIVLFVLTFFFILIPLPPSASWKRWYYCDDRHFHDIMVNNRISTKSVVVLSPGVCVDQLRIYRWLRGSIPHPWDVYNMQNFSES